MPLSSKDLPAALLRRVGGNIRRHRKAIGMTQEGLAEAAQLSTYFIGSVERGQAALSLRSLSLISRALGVPVALLVDFGVEADREILRRRVEQRLKRATPDELRVVLEVLALVQRARR